MNKYPERPKYQKTRAKIIRVALKLFVKQGIRETSMATLAKRARVSTGSLYNYFRNKDELVREIFREVCEVATGVVLEDGMPEGDVKERFYILMRREIEHKLNNEDHFLFMSMYSSSPLLMELVLDGYRPENHPMITLFAEGREQKVIRQINDEDFYYFIFGGLASWLRWKSFCKHKVDEKDIDNLIHLTWGAISV